MTGITMYNPSMTWEWVRRVKNLSRMKLVLKGIETAEDAKLCLDNGVEGIVVSNHGGRAEESGRPEPSNAFLRLWKRLAARFRC